MTCGGLLTALGVAPLVYAVTTPDSRGYYLLFALVFLPFGLTGVAVGTWLLRATGKRRTRATTD